MIKIYNGHTGEYVDTFRLPTKNQLRQGHPSLKQMMTALNSKGFCTKSQLKVLQKKARVEDEKLVTYEKACKEAAALDAALASAIDYQNDMTVAGEPSLED